MLQVSSNWTQSGNNIRNANSGNVGIGTDDPDEKLDVSGNVLISGSVIINEDLQIRNGIARRHERMNYVNYPNGLVWRRINLSTTAQPINNEEEVSRRIKSGSVVATGITPNVNVFTFNADYYSVEFIGLFYAETTGIYEFGINSDDAGDMYIDGKRVADWYGTHGSGDPPIPGGNQYTIYLEEGFHRLYARFVENTAGDDMTLNYRPPTDPTTWTIIPASVLFHEPKDIIISDNNGNVGIGTTSPSARLQVDGNAVISGTLTSNSLIRGGRLRIGSAPDDGAYNILSGGDLYTRGHIFLHANQGIGESGDVYIQARDKEGSDLNLNLHLRTTHGGSIRTPIFCSSSGNVNIGSTTSVPSTPSATLQVNGDALISGRVGIGRSVQSNMSLLVSGGEQSPKMLMIHADGGSSTSEVRAGIGFSNHGGTSWSSQAIGSLRRGSNGFGDLLFMLRNNTTNNDVTTADEKMRITAEGNVGIGTTSQNSKVCITHFQAPQANNEHLLEITGRESGDYRVPLYLNRKSTIATNHIQKWHSDSGSTNERQAVMNVNGRLDLRNGTAPLSDDRIKYYEEFITDATDTLMKLRPQKYRKGWLGTDVSGNYGIYLDDSGNEVKCEMEIESGLIAQEIYYDTPELRHLVNVPEDASGIEQPPEDYYENRDNPEIDPDFSNWGTTEASVNYTGLIPYLIQGFKEQQTIINNLKNEVNELKSKLY